MSAAASASNNSVEDLLSQVSNINFSKVPSNIYVRRQLNELKMRLAVLNISIKKYDKLFNYTKYYENKISALVENIEKLSREGVKINNERIVSRQANIQSISQNYLTTKEIMNSPNVLAKKVTLQNFITTLEELYNAYRDVTKSIMSIPANVLFKKDGMFGKTPEAKQEALQQDLLNIQLSVKSQLKKFTDLKAELDSAETAQKAGETAAKLEARLKKLRGNFNSASSIPIASISTPAQRNKISKVIEKIQRKFNTTSKGGNRRRSYQITRKRRN